MPTLEEVLKGRTFKKVSKEELGAQQTALKKTLWCTAHMQYLESVSSPEKFQHYLDTQYKSTHEPINVMLGMTHYENLGEMHELLTWESMGKSYIKKGERAFYIFKGDVNGGKKPVRVYEESQLQKHPNPKGDPQYTLMEQVDLLTRGKTSLCMVEKVQEGELGIYYNPESKVIEVDRTLDIEQVLQGLIREYCHESYARNFMTYNRQKASFTCNIAAYMICKKIGVEPDCTFLNDVKSNFHGADAHSIREKIEMAYLTYKTVNDKIEKNIHLKNKEKYEYVK